jgi:resuscitation-promoting factor RpfA
VKRRVAGLVAAVSLTGCTSAEVAAWLDWYNTHPAAAEDYLARPEVQAAIATEPADRIEPPRSLWDDLAACESGEQWDYNGPSGFDGGLQFAPSTWRGSGGEEFADYAWQATRDEQIIVAERLLAEQGWQAWPGCSRQLGLR